MDDIRTGLSKCVDCVTVDQDSFKVAVDCLRKRTVYVLALVPTLACHVNISVHVWMGGLYHHHHILQFKD